MDNEKNESPSTCNQCQKRKIFNCSVPSFGFKLVENVSSLQEFVKEFEGREWQNPNSGWFFRGQLSCHSLKTSLERACDLSPKTIIDDAPAIEGALIREFQRWYDGDNQQDVRTSTLYCMSVMQHYGAPTRLLDWTYSPYVALYFAVEKAYDANGEQPFSLWCLDSEWCYSTLLDSLAKQNKTELAAVIKRRRGDKERRDDKTFKQVYMSEGNRIRFVLPENPFYFHKRLYAQQSVALCPGDVSVPFEENLRSSLSIGDSEEIGNARLIKFCCKWKREELYETLEQFRRMNLYRAVLFPDIEGFSAHMKYRLPFFKTIWQSVQKSTK